MHSFSTIVVICLATSLVTFVKKKKKEEEIRIGWTLKSLEKSGWSSEKFSRVDWLK